MRPEFRARLAEFVGTHRAWLREQVEEWVEEFSNACDEARVDYTGILGPGETWTSIGAEEFDRRRAERREELAKERKFPPLPLPPPDPIIQLSFAAKCAGLAAYYDAHCELNYQHPDILVVPEIVIEYPTPGELETRRRFQFYEYTRDNVAKFEQDWEEWERRLEGWHRESLEAISGISSGADPIDQYRIAATHLMIALEPTLNIKKQVGYVEPERDPNLGLFRTIRYCVHTLQKCATHLGLAAPIAVSVWDSRESPEFWLDASEFDESLTEGLSREWPRDSPFNVRLVVKRPNGGVLRSETTFVVSPYSLVADMAQEVTDAMQSWCASLGKDSALSPIPIQSDCRQFSETVKAKGTPGPPFTVNLQTNRITPAGGTPEDVTSEVARMAQLLLDYDGEWVAMSKHGFTKPSEVQSKLPKAVQDILETQKGKGYRLKPRR